MTTEQKNKIKPLNTENDKAKEMFLVLYNDDVNTFDFVIESLVSICKHEPQQAEQCAIITHFKGKCDIKKGQLEFLKPMKDSLISKGLSAIIE